MLNAAENIDVNRFANSNAPVGVFDSGIGGLSVVKHLRQQLPHERFLYVADSGYAPYGERSEQEIIDRSIKITEFFLERGIKALVVACNTATAAAVAVLRQRYPDLIIIGIEPGLKPAAAKSQSKIVGVLATRSTLQSQKFHLLREQLSAETQTNFIPQACVGLVNLIEQGDLESPAILELLRQYVPPLLIAGADTLVLGCTHYPFVESVIRQVIKEWLSDSINTKNISIIDTGDAVARRLLNLLEKHQITNQISLNSVVAPKDSLVAWATGDIKTLNLALGFLAAEDEAIKACQVCID